MNCPRCGTPMRGGVCPECGFPVTRYLRIKNRTNNNNADPVAQACGIFYV